MPALPPYIPPKDVDLTTWSDNFSTLITASPGTYGLVAGDAAAIAAVNAAWAVSFSTCAGPTTRTPAAIAAKVTAKVNLLATVRPYAQQIANNAGVSIGNKIALGLNPRTSIPTKITTPTTSPSLTIVSAPPLQHILRFRDAMASPSVKAKPYGVTAMQLVGKLDASPTVPGGDGPDVLPLQATLTKSPALITWSSGDAGKLATYYGRWITRTGLVGPWSVALTYTVAG